MNTEFPEDLITDILWRLPTGEWIARFRCVCKSWRTLFSGPAFIFREKPRDSRHQIMINFIDNDNKWSVYNLHSADTLEPLLPSPVQLPFNVENPLENNHGYWSRIIKIAGSCNGLICIADGNYDLILWNPATSKTKLVRRSPFCHSGTLEHVGFGFDPETEDYKIIRQFEYEDGSWGCSYFLEVYCLRNDSWSKLADNSYYLRACRGQIPQCNKGKLYWWDRGWEPKSLLFESFAISSQEFEGVGLPFHSEIDAFGNPECLLDEESMVALFPFKDADSGGRYAASWEIWALLRYWVPESWTKLFVVANPPPGMVNLNFSGISRNLKWLFYTFRTSEYWVGGENDRFLIAIRPAETGNFNYLHDLYIPIKRWLEIVINYTPSHVCMRDFYASS